MSKTIIPAHITELDAKRATEARVVIVEELAGCSLSNLPNPCHAASATPISGSERNSSIVVSSSSLDVSAPAASSTLKTSL